jgi:hypothetical protein
VITGKGRHAKRTKEHVVRDAVCDVCKDLDFPDPIQSEVNEGILILTNTRFIPTIQSL